MKHKTLVFQIQLEGKTLTVSHLKALTHGYDAWSGQSRNLPNVLKSFLKKAILLHQIAKVPFWVDISVNIEKDIFHRHSVNFGSKMVL